MTRRREEKNGLHRHRVVRLHAFCSLFSLLMLLFLIAFIYHGPLHSTINLRATKSISSVIGKKYEIKNVYYASFSFVDSGTFTKWHN